jgi:histone deacetylase 6
VTPEAYGYFTHWLSALAGGRVILCLEGGYNVNSISYAMTMCTKALLGDPLPMLQVQTNPRYSASNLSCRETLHNVYRTQSQYWKCLKFDKKLPSYDIAESPNPEPVGDLLMDFEEKLKVMGDADNKENQQSGEQMMDGLGDAEQAGPSKPVEKKQTLTDYLADNLEVSVNFVHVLLIFEECS